MAHSLQSLLVTAAHMLRFAGRSPALRHLSIPPASKGCKKMAQAYCPSKLLWRMTLPCREADKAGGLPSQITLDY